MIWFEELKRLGLLEIEVIERLCRDDLSCKRGLAALTGADQRHHATSFERAAHL